MPIERHLNPCFEGLAPSATVAINEHSNALLRGGREVFKLGLGQSPFPVPEIVAENLRRNAHQKDYLPVRGLAELRQAVATYHSEREGIELSPDHIMIGPGSKELMFLLQMAYSGDLLIPSPSWVSYEPQAKLLGRSVTFLETDRANDWRLTADALDAHCRQSSSAHRLLILNTPNNPLGGCYPATELREIAECARRHKVLLLSDEIYGEIQHDGQHVSIARFYPEGTIISSGLSKWCGAGGWRLGTFAFPAELSWLCKAIEIAASETFTSTSAPIQHAAVAAYPPGPELQDYLEKSRRILSGLGSWIAGRLRSAGIHCAEPTGAFYIFGDASDHQAGLVSRGIDGSRAFCVQLLEDTGVAVLPGCDFSRPSDEFSFRAAYVDFDGRAALEAAGEDVDEAFLRTHCGRVLEAFDRLSDWVQKS